MNKFVEELVASLTDSQNGQNKGKIVTTTERSKDTMKIIIPETMSKKAAAEDLMNQWKNEEEEQNFTTSLEGWDWKDALVAIKSVFEREFGWVQGVQTWSSTPTEIDVVTDIKNGKAKTQKAFYGKIKISQWEHAVLTIGVRFGLVSMTVPAKKKFREQIDKLFEMIREELAVNSIYRNKAIEVTTEVVENQTILKYDITELKENKSIVLNENEELAVSNFIIDQLDEKEKRTFLFTGDYGNAKTETASRVALAAIKTGRTFFYCKRANQLSKVLEFSRRYEPAIIFVEDIDEVAAGEQRDNAMNTILNTVDGVQTKGRDIITMFTTNHIDSINTALRRPGRIDMIIKFENPNKETIRKIGDKFLYDLPGAVDLDWEHILAKFPDVQGAVVAEVFKRTTKIANKQGVVKTEHVLGSIASMAAQIEFMKKPAKQDDKLEKALTVVGKFVNRELLEKIEDVREAL